MDLYLGVDGGGSGCRAAVADAGGRILGRGDGGPANVWSDPEGARASILAAAGAALAAAGGGRLADLRAVLGVAGANVPEAAARLAADLPFAAARIESDAFVSLKGALGDDDGVVAAIGTGSVYGVQRGGGVRMIGGWGFLLGDQGSGAGSAGSLLEAALLAHDGLAAPSRCSRASSPSAAGRRGSSPSASARGRRTSPPRPAARRRRGGRATPVPRRSSPRRTDTSPRAVDALMAAGRCRCAFSAASGRLCRPPRRPLSAACPRRRRAARSTARSGWRGRCRERALRPGDFADEGAGPLYLQLIRRIGAAIDAGGSSPARACRPSGRWRR